jgi:diguanylate cyclase (GGDEF)-like protein
VHKLLARQLARATGRAGEVELEQLLRLVDAAYREADLERQRLDRALLTCEEMDELNDELRQLAHHDALTGLPNRLSFAEFAKRAVQRAKLGETVAVLLIDLDRFKPVNDTFGHAIGDALLREVAARLRAAVRSEDEIARTGGDEFAVIQYDAELVRGTEALAGRLVESLSAPYHLSGQVVEIGASVGVAVAGPGVPAVNSLLHNADLALYRAKNEGRCRWRVFEPCTAARRDEPLSAGERAAS